MLDYVYALAWHPNDIAAAFTVTFNVSGDIDHPRRWVGKEVWLVIGAIDFNTTV